METAATLKMFERSIEKFGFRYTTLLNDGDSSVFNQLCKLNNNNGPYGADHPVENEDCINHVSKRMRNNLDNVVQKNKAKGCPIDGKGRLTKDRVVAMQNYYGRAIKDHVHDLSGMVNGTWSIFFHYLDDGKPHHNHCPKGSDSWCWYNRQIADGIAVPVRGEHTTPLPLHVLEAIKPVFERLCSPQLLKRCLRGGTQNNNECLNSVIWTRAPKHKNASLLTIKNAVARGILEFNKGSTTLIDIMDRASLSPGPNAKRFCQKKDNQRIKKSAHECSERFKKIRKEKESLRKSIENKRKEGKTYGAGMS
ncbi:hypothetical protein SNE40_012997 [Patella caerulea]|uniref:Mutator-like transposase domain-containing protein n=1 Tax=Patella caerulea TaxID=87958 RepID=A0AAN8JIU1_PATCE